MIPNTPDWPIKIDLYSDTLTRPSEAMRHAMASAEVGDEQKGEDPSTNVLLNLVRELLGKEEAVLLPSGTMCNEIAFAVHCRPGDEILLDSTAHPLHYEAGAPAALAGAMVRAIDGDHGIFTAEQVDAAVHPASRYAPQSVLLSVEQTSNLGGGRCWPLEDIRSVTTAARRHGMRTHMDGARLFNAVVATGVAAQDYSAPFDSVFIDLTKGLGAPIGAVLAGDRDFIDKVWRLKQRWGGAMRQSGIIAAAGTYALTHNMHRLADDHANALLLAEMIATHPRILLDPTSVQTNIVIFDILNTTTTAEDLTRQLLQDSGIRVGAFGPTTIRAVTHLDVGTDKIPLVAEAICSALDSKNLATQGE
ncbi:threonine aldolase family protein [Ferrimicrobium acidiphilum]|uniref:threonine aldolase family protein n=1 Tax=Ferrimicrobium acidiphilum TaxID=121039 RepID=UPI0023F3D8E7|nr:threonine aldolase family protein [Ferrimicrobium acidiphilum]